MDKQVAFDEHEFDFRSLRLTKGGVDQHLTALPATVLAALIRRHGELIPYSELTAEVWPDHKGRPRARNLQVAVSELRTTLGWKDTYPIRTVPTLGYQFVAEVRSLKAAEARVGGNGSFESVSGGSGEVAIETAIPQPTPAEPQKKSKSIIWVSAGLAVVLVVAVALAWPRPNPHHLRLDGQTLVALSEGEKEVWRFPLEHPIATNISLPENGWLVADIDGDGRNETLFYLNMSDADTVLYCLSPRGRVLWTMPAGRPFQTHAGKLRARKEFVGNILGVLKRPRTDGSTIITGAHSLEGFGQQVAALRPDGKLTAAYWHPGWVFCLRIADLDGDGKEEILLGAVNNSFLNQTGPWDDVKRGLTGAALVVLDHDFQSSQGRTRERGDAWTFDNLPQGLERDVILFNSPIRVPDEYYFSVTGISVGPDTVVVNNATFRGVVHYTLDRRLNFITAMASSGIIANSLLESVKPLPQNSNDFAPAINRIVKNKMWRLKADEGVWVRQTTTTGK